MVVWPPNYSVLWPVKFLSDNIDFPQGFPTTYSFQKFQKLLSSEERRKSVFTPIIFCYSPHLQTIYQINNIIPNTLIPNKPLARFHIPRSQIRYSLLYFPFFCTYGLVSYALQVPNLNSSCCASELITN